MTKNLSKIDPGVKDALLDATPVQRALLSEPRSWRRNIIVLVILGALLAWSSSAVDLANMTEGGMKIVNNIFSGLIHPDKALLFSLSEKSVAYLLFETICIAFLGTLVGAVLAVPLAFVSATNIVPAPLALIGRTVLMAIRTVPVMVYGLMFMRVTGPGPFAGLMTMGLASIGMVAKMYIEYIEDLDTRILESLDAAGCTLFQKIRFGIIAQLIPDFLSTIIYRFDMNLRDATVLGLVGAGGIGAPLIFAMQAYRWSEAGAILWGLLLLILMIEVASTRIRVKLAQG
ncbi:MAG: phosphonate ABC transporter, permease protein PhnE [Propionibacteriaceae bacterium]|jgi:phosphonate transport system permease protein|nr:phosphonate ABC transporter, permease protein PhnE [Propionibacteriaceae bacterium]